MRKLVTILSAHKYKLLVIAAGLLILIIVWGCASIPDGHVGVVDVSGNMTNTPLEAGFHFVNPLAHVYKLETGTQQIGEHLRIPARDGVTVGLDLVILYHLIPDSAVQICKEYRQLYPEGDPHPYPLLARQYRSLYRQAAGKYDAVDLDSSAKEAIEQEVFDQLKATVLNLGLIVESVRIQFVSPPP